jgi:hypothetical protein
MEKKHLKPLYTAIIKLLRPLAKILLRNGVSYGTFADLAKWVFVDVATKEFVIKNRKQSTSRISVITGLSRREVMRVRKLPKPDITDSIEKHNRAARVIAAWRRESEFLDTDGKPAPLPLDGDGTTFSELVKRFSGNMPPRAVLDELINVEAVSESFEDNTVTLLTRAYIPKNYDSHKINILGTDVKHLLSTINHNLQPGLMKPIFQRKVSYDNLPDEILEKFHNQFNKKAQDLLESADKWLAKHDRDVTPSVKGVGRNQAGFGIFFFQKPYSDEDK